MKRVVLVAAVVALAVPAGAAAAPVVRTGVSPGAVLFGDPVVATATVAVDSSVYDPSTIAFVAPTGPWVVQSRDLTSAHAGRLVSRSLALQLVCRTTACVPAGAATKLTLPPLTATVRRRAGGTVRIHATWPPIVVASRLAAGAASEARPPFALQTDPPPAHGRISAGLAAALLALLAVALAAAAIVLAASQLRRRRPAARAAVPPLARALALVREAETRPASDRRRALALLARLTSSPESKATAWSADDPTPDQLEEIARGVEGHT